MSKISIPAKTLEASEHIKVRSAIYLPKEGLQGEDIPSYILWENAEAKTIRISYQKPLKIKHVFNAEDYLTQDDNIIIEKTELEGYVGLSFETSKVSDLEITVPVDYSILLSNGNTIEKKKRIKLFRPQLEIIADKDGNITVDSDTGFVHSRPKIRNVGRGTILMAVSETEESTVKVRPPPEYLEFTEKFMSDVSAELQNLAERFPQLRPILDELLELENVAMTGLLEDELDKIQNRLLQYRSRLATVLASDRDLTQGFVEAYRNAMAKNSELLEVFRRFLKVYESLVSKSILLINPFDEVILTGKEEDLALTMVQTDKVFDSYEDLKLPRLLIKSSKPVRVPIYNLFEWG